MDIRQFDYMKEFLGCEWTIGVSQTEKQYAIHGFYGIENICMTSVDGGLDYDVISDMLAISEMIEDFLLASDIPFPIQFDFHGNKAKAERNREIISELELPEKLFSI